MSVERFKFYPSRTYIFPSERIDHIRNIRSCYVVGICITHWCSSVRNISPAVSSVLLIASESYVTQTRRLHKREGNFFFFEKYIVTLIISYVHTNEICPHTQRETTRYKSLWKRYIKQRWLMRYCQCWFLLWTFNI